MIDLETGILIAGGLALVSSFLLRFYCGKLKSMITPDVTPARPLLRREILPAGLATAVGAIIIYLAAGDGPSSLAFLAGAFSAFLASVFLVRPSAVISNALSPGETSSEKLRRLSAGASGLFIGGLTTTFQGLLYLLDKGETPALWFFSGLGAAAAALIGSALSRFGNKSFTRNFLSDLYAAYFLSFCIPAAMGFLAVNDIPDWVEISQTVLLAGIVLSVIGTWLCLATAGRVRQIYLAFSGILLAVAAFISVREVMAGLPSQSLVSTGMMDRMGSLWAIGVGLVTAILIRSLFSYYRAVHRNRAIFMLPLFFIVMNIWIAYASAGFYGIALSAGGAAGLLPLMVSLDLGGARWDAIEGYIIPVSCFAAAGVGAYIFLQLNFI